MSNKIQLITYPPINPSNFQDITIAHFKTFNSLDSFEYNLINLNLPDTIKKPYSSSQFYKESDYQSLKINRENSNNCNIIVLLPQNLNVKDFGEIKNRLDNVYIHITKFYPLKQLKLVFGKNETKINEKEFNADFYLNNLEDSCKVITKNTNNNVTTIEHENIIYTTLNLKTNEDILSFVDFIDELNESAEAPDWFENLEYYDDKKLKDNINVELEKIRDSKIKIDESENILKQNNHFKSILYTNSDELVKVVFEIIEEILGCDLSDFIDEKKEDFLIKFENKQVLIGEIKGVTSNVRFEYIDQVERHYHNYIEDYPDESENEEIKQILIINYERTKKPSERREIHEDQIKLANRNRCLILDTPSLLKVHELFRDEKLETDDLKEYIFSQSGLFNVDDLK